MYPGIDGFLGTRASLMLDVVFVSVIAVIPLLLWSISLVRYRQNYRLHKRIQVMLGLVLLVAVTLFEVDMRFLTDWRQRAQPSPYYATWVFPSRRNTTWRCGPPARSAGWRSPAALISRASRRAGRRSVSCHRRERSLMRPESGP